MQSNQIIEELPVPVSSYTIPRRKNSDLLCDPGQETPVVLTERINTEIAYEHDCQLLNNLSNNFYNFFYQLQ